MHYKKVSENYFQKIYANGTKKRISRKEYLEKIKKQKGGEDTYYLLTKNENKTSIGNTNPNDKNVIQITMDGDVYNYYKVQSGGGWIKNPFTKKNPNAPAAATANAPNAAVTATVDNNKSQQKCEEINSKCKEDDFICGRSKYNKIYSSKQTR